MKLVGIEFHGFKSFADSAAIKFHDGITAIVGPNGCGKSNISDGLRWVLGEQRPTAIRGSRMEEAIFQGTQRRKPIHRAEVTLRLSNEDHLLPVPYTDVQISRTVFTGGESEYRLNGTVCRLRDIQDLCRDTGLGANAYAIIEGRMVDAILSDKAEERRSMFEEAAGIGRYKERRRVASRRLEEADGDLARVDDLLSEVQTKVRSLARQRGRARRFLDLRERKIALELAVAQAELERLNGREREIAVELRSLDEARVEDAAQLRTSEAQIESLRTRSTDLERERAAAARELGSVRERLATRDRERLLAEERSRHASARLDQVEFERRELDEGMRELEAELERLRTLSEERRSATEALRESLRGHEIEVAEVAERRQAMEAAAAAVESEGRAYREEQARREAGRDAARAEAEELGRRLEEARAWLASASANLEQAAAAEEEARAEAARAEERLRSSESELQTQRSRLADAETRRDELRGRRAALEERRQAHAARMEELRPLASSETGLNPAVQAALERRAELGIHGILGDSLQAPEEFADGIESYLGDYLEGLIVDNRAAVAGIRRWFLDEYDGPGGLVVLPLDRCSDEDASDLPPGVEARGPGAPWLRRLLRGVTMTGQAPEGDAAWIGQRQSFDRLGVLRLGRPQARAGLLARKAELERLEAQLDRVQTQARQVDEEVQNAETELARQAARVAELESSRQRAGVEAGRAVARAGAEAERRAHLEGEVQAGRQRVARLDGEREAALARASSETEALASLVPAEVGSAPDPEALARVRAEWEERRERLTALQLDEARAAAALERVERELRSQQGQLKGAKERYDRLGGEAAQLRTDLTRAREESEAAARDLESLFEERETLESRARDLDERVEAERQKVAELESQLKRLQHEERSHSERRHELELERTQIAAELLRTRERLEDEWGRSFEELSREVQAAEGDPSALRAELRDVAERLGSIGLVNMLAEREYQEERERLEFLEDQRADLAKARDDLRETIRQINQTASAALLETLEQVRANFKRTFATLFQGGECDVWLENPDDPLDSPVEISASPRGKRTQRIHLLSGGERALTALALLFAFYLVKPSPFCILDEVDAPLDETNILRFVAMLEEFKSGVQFIVITHNPVTIEAADWIYGVTMEEPGVSKIVGVEFSDYARGAVA